MFLVSMLRTGSYVKQMKSIQLFNPSSVIYMRTQVNSSTIANICWLIQTFKYPCCGLQVHFKSILVCNLKTKSDFWSKCPHCIMGYITNLSSMFFLFSLFLNLAYIDYTLCKIWSVYMQYLRYCDHSNKCLFLVIQLAEVLLKFFWWVYDKLVAESKIGIEEEFKGSQWVSCATNPKSYLSLKLFNWTRRDNIVYFEIIIFILHET